MKIKVISDLHLDINEDFPFVLNEKDIFTIVCGDISADTKHTMSWLNQNLTQGIFVAGNHMSYNNLNHSIEYFYSLYQKAYPLNAPISFMENQYKIIDDIVFVGGTLWTDYQLFGSQNQETSMQNALKCLNDFEYSKTNISGNLKEEPLLPLARITPKYCLDVFNKTISFIDKVCNKFPNKKVVVITHHAPSIKSVPKTLKNKEYTPCFASHLDDFILNHPNIKLWCSGHIHSFSDYYIGKCRVVCNPRGYTKYNEETNFKENFIIEV